MKEFDCDNFKMRIGDDLIKEVLVKKGKTFTEADVLLSKNLSESYKPGAKFLVLMEGEADSTTTVKARELAASLEYGDYTRALALCSRSLPHAIMGNLYLKVSKPVTPTRFFEKREEALQWLRKKANQT